MILSLSLTILDTKNQARFSKIYGSENLNFIHKTLTLPSFLNRPTSSLGFLSHHGGRFISFLMCRHFPPQIYQLGHQGNFPRCHVRDRPHIASHPPSLPLASHITIPSCPLRYSLYNNFYSPLLPFPSISPPSHPFQNQLNSTQLDS